MQTLTAHYQIVTPMFIGGANRDDTPEIRPPSIKGALRFWWRALHWGECLQHADNDANKALHLLYQQEAELFGAATKEKHYGQGLCLLKLTEQTLRGEEKSWPENNDPGAGFLGYGLDKTQSGEPHRRAIAQGRFTVELILKAAITEQQILQLKNTLIIWGLLGGLGSRNRRGFGSIAIHSLNKESFDFKNIESYIDTIKKQLGVLSLAPPMPPFTAINQAIQITKAGHAKDYTSLMNQLGSQYKQARINAGKGLNKRPFGLPLAGNKGESDEEHRRASPLFMHIHAIGQSYVAMISFIPAVFHPAHPQGNNLDFYQPLHDYLKTMERVYP